MFGKSTDYYAGYRAGLIGLDGPTSMQGNREYWNGYRDAMQDVSPDRVRHEGANDTNADYPN